MKYQQNLAGRKIGIVVLSKQQWPELKPHVQLVVAAVDAAKPGSYTERCRNDVASNVAKAVLCETLPGPLGFFLVQEL
jgi:hypothetical protein